MRPKTRPRICLARRYPYRSGPLEIEINYTKGTANNSTAMIDDKEIVWTPKGKQGLAVINRYTGLMRMSQGRREFIGMCNRKPVQGNKP